MPKSHDLPAVQCKDTLLLDYDHNQQYSKRILVNNWNRYDEPADEENNAQMSAASFEQILSASKCVGNHFTFASERNWLHNEDAKMDATDLFKLNVTNLKNGLGRLPFYVRQGIPKSVFNEFELTDMDYRVNFFENDTIPKPSSINQNIVNILTNTNSINTVPDAKKSICMHDTIKQTIDSDSLVKLLQTTSIQSKPLAQASALAQKSNQKGTKKDKTEDIQDWLDDILNED